MSYKTCPEWPELMIAEVWENEQPQLMPAPQPFDGYLELPVRVSGTALIHEELFRSVAAGTRSQETAT